MLSLRAAAALAAVLLLPLSGCADQAAAGPGGTPPPATAAVTPGRITNADPAMEYRSGTASAALTTDYTPEQITGAQRTLIRFLADEAIGPRSAGPAGWWEANGARFAAAYRQDARRAGESTDGGLLLPDFPAGSLTSRTITVERVAERADGAVTVTAAFDYAYTDRGGASQHTTGTATGAVVNDPRTGAWLIAGFKVITEPDPQTI